MNFFSFLFGRGNNTKKADSTYLLSEEAKRAAAWIETTNPLRGMTASRMQALYDASRNGDTVHLQWLYNEIEKSDPTLLICASRRRGALASLDWSVKTRSENRMRNFDKVLAGEQVKTVEAAFGEAELGGFNDALEHLAGAFFRGFAHVLPKWSADGLVIEGFETLDNWNFVRDLMTGTWYWNPEASAYTDYGSCRPIPQGELLTMVAPYHIDYPMLTIYLRQAVGEKGWAKFVERFGIPPVILTMPSDIPSDQVEMWRAQAEKVAEGGSGAVPAGTQVNFCDGARGINPFKDFINNQRELTVLMATGGLLTSLAQSGSGTLAGGAHSDTWAEVRRMDSSKIASALNAQIVKPLLSRAFPGKAQLVYFDFDTEATPSPGEVFEDAAKARSAGYLIDQAELEEKTGYKLVKDAPRPMPGMGGEVALNKDAFTDKTAQKNPGPSGSGEKGDHNAILKAFAEDSSAAAGEIRDLLENPSPEKAAALLQKLPELLPEDPAMAAVIAEAMAAEFGKMGNGEDVENVERVPAGHGNAGQFTGKTNQPRGKEPETKSQHDRWGLNDPERLAVEPQKNAERAKNALDEVIRKKSGYADKAAYRQECGWIRFDWGDPGNPHKDWNGGHGIAHIQAKHPRDLKYLPDVIAKGEAFRHPTDETKTYFVFKDRFAVVASLHKGAKKTITEFEPERAKDIATIKNYPRALAPGKKGG